MFIDIPLNTLFLNKPLQRFSLATQGVWLLGIVALG